MISEKEQDELWLQAKNFVREIRLEYKKMRLGDRDAERKKTVQVPGEVEGLDASEASL